MYRGSWIGGKRNGFGVEFDPKTKKTYLGEWLNDEKHGKGREINFNGDEFDGTWRNGVKNGRGIRRKTTG